MFILESDGEYERGDISTYVYLEVNILPGLDGFHPGPVPRSPWRPARPTDPDRPSARRGDPRRRPLTGEGPVLARRRAICDKFVGASGAVATELPKALVNRPDRAAVPDPLLGDQARNIDEFGSVE